MSRSRNLAADGDGVPPELPTKLMTPAVCVIVRQAGHYPPRDGYATVSRT